MHHQPGLGGKMLERMHEVLGWMVYDKRNAERPTGHTASTSTED
jgi:hypothetical protein